MTDIYRNHKKKQCFHEGGRAFRHASSSQVEEKRNRGYDLNTTHNLNIQRSVTIPDGVGNSPGF